MIEVKNPFSLDASRIEAQKNMRTQEENCRNNNSVLLDWILAIDLDPFLSVISKREPLF